MLVLLPTTSELNLLVPEIAGRHSSSDPSLWPDARPAPSQAVMVACCGVGPTASAVGTTRLLERTGARRVLLAGLAGTLRPDLLPPGSALLATVALCDGVGVGEGEGFVPVRDLDGPLADLLPPERLELAAPEAPGWHRGAVLGACSASASPADVTRRLRDHPDAVAEDLESHAVAVAARSFGATLSVVRGVSNVAGDRAHGGWRVREAMSAARALVDWLLSNEAR